METYSGHVRTPTDAIILFEACRIGLLPRVQRRLSEKERQSIKSGSVFVWDEREAGMRRWTDGKSWSASRVSGSFLTYREMEGKRGGGGMEKNANRDGVPGNDGDSDGGPDGYRYKPDGLMKQSFSITTNNGQHLHLISYFSRSSATSQNLMQPSNDPQLRHIRPEKGMYPESTVHEQSNIPAVTRGPMSSPGGYTHAPSQPPAYGRQAQYNYAPPAYPPSPMHTPPPHTQYSPYYQQPPHGPYPGQSPLQNMHYPPPGYGQAPAMTAFDRPPPPLSNTGHPPPPAHQYPAPMPQQSSYQNAYGYQTGYQPYQPPSYPPPPQQPTYDTRSQQAEDHQHQHQPQLQQYQHQQYNSRPDPRYEAPPASAPPPAQQHQQPNVQLQQPSQPQPQHARPEDAARSPTPADNQQPQATPGAPTLTSAPTSSTLSPAPTPTPAHPQSQTIPSISAMLNGGASGAEHSPSAVTATAAAAVAAAVATRTSSTSPGGGAAAAPPTTNNGIIPPGSAGVSLGAASGGLQASMLQGPLQDIPSHKLGFEANRDVQALRNLDKSTFKY